MNPDQHRASEVRRRALVDQIDGLEQRISDGRNELHVTKRLSDTRIELAELQGSHQWSQLALRRPRSVVWCGGFWWGSDRPDTLAVPTRTVFHGVP
jgi:hypothetical protein